MTVIDELKDRQRRHPIWTCRLLTACAAGGLTVADLRYVFSQYLLYSRSFTRYLAALMAICDDDGFRARITENLWEESGACVPEERHSAIYRRFLEEGLGVDVEGVAFDDGTRAFSAAYLDFFTNRHPMEGAAFLALGTEGIVARLYGIFAEGLTAAGVPEEHLRFFRIHMACDDSHAATLEELMLHYEGEHGFAERCAAAVDRALDLRLRFFESLFDAIQARRIAPVIGAIQARKSLVPAAASGGFHAAAPLEGAPLYANTIPRLKISFSVERLPFQCEVLDPRIVRIPSASFNEHHRHAHETIFFVVAGQGQVVIDEITHDVGAGDVVFAPRWCMHQSRNTGPGEMVLLAVTDFGLTGKAFVGDYEKTARLKRRAQAASSVAEGDARRDAALVT